MALKLNQMTVRRIGGVKVSSILIKWFLVRQLMASLQIGGARVSRRERWTGGDMRGGEGGMSAKSNQPWPAVAH